MTDNRVLKKEKFHPNNLCVVLRSFKTTVCLTGAVVQGQLWCLGCRYQSFYIELDHFMSDCNMLSFFYNILQITQVTFLMNSQHRDF